MPQTATLHRDALTTSARLTGVLTMLETTPGATVADVRLALGRHSLLLPFLFLTLLSLLLTIIPYTSAVVGLLMLVPAVQIAMGREQLWLPRTWLNRPAPRATMQRRYPRLIAIFRQLEKLIYPRFPQFSEAPLHHLSGFLFVFLSLAIALPIPFGNIAPAVALLFLTFGHLEKDGSLIAIGQMVGLLTLGGLIVIVSAMVGAFGAADLLLGSRH